MFIDTHAHLTESPLYTSLQKVIEDALSAGVNWIINVATDVNSTRLGISIAEEYENILSSVGIHPHYADSQRFGDIKDFASCPEIIAIGETGLDFYRNLSGKEAQLRLFEKHIELAYSLNLPVIIHQRNAMEDVKSLISNSSKQIKGIMHCFSGGLSDAEWFIERGFFISFAGNLTFPKANRLKEVAKQIPMEWILLETDCPWLTPQPVRGKINKPSYIVHTYHELARLRGETVEEIADRIKENFKTLFNLPA